MKLSDLLSRGSIHKKGQLNKTIKLDNGEKRKRGDVVSILFQIMFYFITSCIQYIWFHKWNKIDHNTIRFMDACFEHKPISGLRLWLWNKLKEKNEYKG